eukprot:2840709-Pleurochrysis_carterae.AAC.1
MAHNHRHAKQKTHVALNKPCESNKSHSRPILQHNRASRRTSSSFFALSARSTCRSFDCISSSALKKADIWVSESPRPRCERTATECSVSRRCRESTFARAALEASPSPVFLSAAAGSACSLEGAAPSSAPEVSNALFLAAECSFDAGIDLKLFNLVDGKRGELIRVYRKVHAQYTRLVSLCRLRENVEQCLLCVSRESEIAIERVIGRLDLPCRVCTIVILLLCVNLGRKPPVLRTDDAQAPSHAAQRHTLVHRQRRATL